MVEFYFGELVEQVRNGTAASWLLEEERDEDEGPDDGEDRDSRRASHMRGPLDFCPEGCYWRCEHG
jgi:hypothetical protein